ncbi:diguanylate cyclase, partial [Oleiphilus sp. HI0061]
FFLDGNKELEKAVSQSTPVSVALLSVDQMHNIQDKHGLDAPDITMRNLTTLLPKAFNRFQYARINDSDVAILMAGLSLEQAAKLVDGFRELVEDHIVMIDEFSFNFTVSAGITENNNNSLIELLKNADNRLYLARENGENQVWFED